MPRGAREQSSTNIYHAMVRGINRQNIFEDSEDCTQYLSVLQVCKEISHFKLYAYCLMSNHVHLLIETTDEPLSQIFKRIGSRYVYWYNNKYQRVGHLFQDRYKSENVENDAYFLTVLRYILQNPMKAGLETNLGCYCWSSYRDYRDCNESITDIQFAIDLIGSQEQLLDFVSQTNDDKAMEISDFNARLSDAKAKEVMFKLSSCSLPSDYQLLNKSLQKEYSRTMYREGLSMGQISRLTGMSKTAVYSVVHQ